MCITSILTAILYGIVEGITEWLPISSTGHLIILEKLVPLGLDDRFRVLFDVVIQLFAVLAVITVYIKKLNPFEKNEKHFIAHDKIKLWAKILVSVIPSAVAGLLLDDLLETYFFNITCVAFCLVFYGIVFLFAEKIRKVNEHTVTLSGAIKIGAFQILSLIPGTSRSGATIIGGLLCGITREAAAEFSFFLALPTMLGASCLKLYKLFTSGYSIEVSEIMLLFIAGASAYVVSLFVIRYLIEYVKKHSFRFFGIYRIMLGLLIFLFM